MESRKDCSLCKSLMSKRRIAAGKQVCDQCVKCETCGRHSRHTTSDGVCASCSEKRGVEREALNLKILSLQSEADVLLNRIAALMDERDRLKPKTGQTQRKNACEKPKVVDGDVTKGPSRKIKKKQSGRGKETRAGKRIEKKLKSSCNVDGLCYLRLLSNATKRRTRNQLLASPTVGLLEEAFKLGLARHAPKHKKVRAWRNADGSFHIAYTYHSFDVEGTSEDVFRWILSHNDKTALVGQVMSVPLRLAPTTCEQARNIRMDKREREIAFKKGGYCWTRYLPEEITPSERREMMDYFGPFMSLDWFFFLFPGEKISFRQCHIYKGNIFVGSAMDIINESLVVNGPDIGKIKATELFNAMYDSVPKTDIRMTKDELARFARYVGFEIMSRQKTHNLNDHKFLQISRQLLRNLLDQRFPHNTDVMKVLHDGCTMTDWKRWRSHKGHHFLFPLCEDKDVSRMVEDVITAIGVRALNDRLPALKSLRLRPVEMKIHGIQEAFRVLEAGHDRRMHTEYPGEEKFDCLMFEDSLYCKTDEEFLALWKKTGAKVGYATMLFPDRFVSDRCVPSEIYHYEEYYPFQETAMEVFDFIWPTVLLLTPLLPFEGMMTAFEHLLRWLLSHGWDLFKGWLTQVATSGFPLEQVSGAAFDLLKFGPIFTKLLDMIKPVIKRKFCRVRVSWVSGYQSGYDHSWHEWSKWLLCRRRWLSSTECIDTEIVERVGEMYLLKFYLSSGTSPLNYSLELSASQQTVLVARPFSAWQPATKTLGPMEYFPVLANDYYKLLNWAMAEHVESLSFAVLMTTLNRVRGGLSLNSNVIVDPMHVVDQDVADLAMAVYLEVLKRKEVVQMFEDNKEYLTAYETNLVKILKIFGKGLVTVASGGLIIPAIYLVKWLLDANPNYEFVKGLEERKIYHEKRRKPTKVETTLHEIRRRDFTLVLPTVGEAAPVDCLMCTLQRLGVFSMNGNPEDGQLFVCEKAHVDPTYSLDMSPAEIQKAIDLIKTARTAHQGFGAETCSKIIKKFEDWVESNLGGIKHSFEIHAIKGGPGTGKSFVIRELANFLESQSTSVAISFPFKKLQADYTHARLANGKTRDFTADTTWYTCNRSNIHTLIVDECTAVNWEVLRLQCAYLGVKRLILVGDNKQTGLDEASGEGIQPYNPGSGIDWNCVPTHELVKNYRLPPWLVKMLNKVYGYRMLATRTDDWRPIFVTVDEYKKIEHGEGHVEMVFAHAAANPVYGKDSAAGARFSDPGDATNMSVRSSQGQTYKTAAISASDLDARVSQAHGMRCVAVSRATKMLYVVCPASTEDPIPMSLKQEWMLDSDDAINAVDHTPYPEIERPKLNYRVTEEEVALNEIIKEKRRLGDVRLIDKQNPDEVEVFDEYVEVQFEKERIPLGTVEKAFVYNKKTGEFVERQKSTIALEATIDIFRQYFHFCLPEVFLNIFANVKGFYEKFFTELSKVVDDDVLMGRVVARKKTTMSLFGGSKITRRALKLVDGKRLLPLRLFEDIATEFGKQIVYFEENRDHKGMLRVIGGTKKMRDVPVESLIKLKIQGHHVTEETPENVDVYHDGSFGQANPFATTGGRFVCEYVVKDKKDGQGKLVFKYHDVVSVADNSPAVDVQVGYVPVCLPDMDRQHLEYALEAEPVRSGWMTKPDFSSPAKVFTPTGKLRLGTNAHLFDSLIDPSSAVLRNTMNHAGPLLGPLVNNNVKPIWEGFLHQRTKRGKIRRFRPKEYFSIAPGFGNHFENTPTESLVAAQRLGRKEAKPRLSAEAKQWVKKTVDQVWKDCFRPEVYVPVEERNYIVCEALKAARERNYPGRMDADIKRHGPGKIMLTCSNKAQFKPIKDDKLDLLKGGQVLLQSPPSINLKFMAWMRVRNYHFKIAMKDGHFYNNLEPLPQLREKITRAIRALPPSAQIGIVDAKEFDCKQSRVTLEFEKQFALKQGVNPTTMEAYYKVRENHPFTMHGVFKGVTNGEKGSGFLDTLFGNTKLQKCLMSLVFTGKGPRVETNQGDDGMRVQSGIQINREGVIAIKRYAKMELKVSVGNGGEFCGDVVTKVGLFPSITRAAMKAVAAKSRDYKQFCEQQISYRQKINEYRACGIEETVHFTALAEKKDPNYVWACLEYLNSMGHIARHQWRAVKRKADQYHLPGAGGPMLL